jgi:ABC-type branched-subunit amino acid transport system substrate-binding protein
VAAIETGGCGLGEGSADVDGPVTVYVSLPLTGPRANEGRDTADGARLALADAGGKAGDLEVRARYLNDAGEGPTVDLARVGANAREAASDSSTAAYIGELDSGPTRTSMPILNDAGIAQVSPGATALDLTRPAPGFDQAPDVYRPSGEVTFVRVAPSEGVGSYGLALSPAGAEAVRRFRSRFGRLPGPYWFYGYEAMAVVLDAIAQRDLGAAGLRASVADSLLKVERFDESVIGPYSFTPDGDTTLGAGP